MWIIQIKNQKIRILKNFEEIIENSQETLRKLTTKKMIMVGILLTTPSKFLEAIAVFLAFQALNIDFDFVISTQIFFTAIVSGVITLLPGGLGVTEASMLGLITKYGGDFSIAATAVIFVRLVTIWYATVLGLITSKFFIRNN